MKTSRFALITGAGSGIGQATSVALSHLGFHILMVGRTESKLKTTQKKLPGTSAILTCDLGDPKDRQKLIKTVIKAVGKNSLEVVVNNAALYEAGAFAKSSAKDWQAHFETNLFAPVALLQGLYPLLKQSHASVINISSTLGERPIPDTAAYSATKAALNSLTHTLALEWAPHVRVNAVLPGLVDTPIHAFHKLAENSPEKQGAHQMQPMKRMGRPEEVAQVVVSLVQNPWATGSQWIVDGGISL